MFFDLIVTLLSILSASNSPDFHLVNFAVLSYNSFNFVSDEEGNYKVTLYILSRFIYPSSTEKTAKVEHLVPLQLRLLRY